MKTELLEKITRHGNNLLALFPNATERDPVKLCKKLRRIEVSLEKPLTDYCNGDISQDEASSAKLKAKTKVLNLLGSAELVRAGFFVNSDPRGFFLKVDDQWRREQFRTRGINLYSDMGGYGILAPDLR